MTGKLVSKVDPMRWSLNSCARQSYSVALVTLGIASLAALPIVVPVQAQEPDPNSDRFVAPTLPDNIPSEIESDSKISIPQPLQPEPTISEIPDRDVTIKQIVIEGITVSAIEKEVEQLKNKMNLEGMTLKLSELLYGTNDLDPCVPNSDPCIPNSLKALSDRITALYLGQNYFTSFATPKIVSIEDGSFMIQVTEGTLEIGRINTTGRLNEAYIRDRILRGVEQPLNFVQLENQLRLLRTDPRISNIEPTLKDAGAEEVDFGDLPDAGIPGRSILDVTIVEAPAYGGKVFIDNYSPPSIGSERMGIELFHRNLSGFGDHLFGSYTRSIPGASETIQVGYAAPLNALEGSLSLKATIHDNEIIQEPFDDLELEGEYQQYEIAYRQPLIRSIQEELALSFGFSFRHGQTFTFAGPTPFSIGPDTEGISRTSVLKFGQDYTRRDGQGSWAVRSQFNFGIGLFDATVNEDPIPDSRFFNWLLQAQRLQVINSNRKDLVILQADLQLSPDSLLPSEQFVIGGGQSVKGFRQNLRAGDNGLRFAIENRTTLMLSPRKEPVFQLAPFINLGTVWNSDNPNPQQDQTFIMGIGTGLIWQPISGLNARLDYAFPITEVDDRGTNAQDDGLYFSLSYGLN